jgi:AraC-like DNA-binding protein
MHSPSLSLQRIARDGSVFELASRAPCAPLRRHVRSLIGFDERSPRPRSRREFPEPWLVVIIEFGPPLRVAIGDDAARNPGGFAAGLGDRHAITQHDGRSCGVQVDLLPTGARRLFGLPMSELGGRIVGLRDLLPPEYDALTDQLATASDWAMRLDLVEAFVLRRIDRARIDTARVDWALAQIESRGGRLDVGSLPRELGYSHKHLIALFHDQVGIPPKLLARLVRFERMIRAARTGEVGWAEIALAHGYFDQAHLARDVKRFTGLTPTEVRALGTR